MHVLPSPLASKVRDYLSERERLAEHGFTLGGNWDYMRGSFDCALDDDRQVWLRLPFEVTSGSLDGESDTNGTDIRYGQPFVLKHVYREGPDKEASPGAIGTVFNQFSDPLDPDGEVEPEWIEKAKSKLNRIEAADSR
ncbi:YugN family protein [Paenibacillaceae bacterium WGS1546]|uniref:YugN family protein n=1 Tax=Cohnella sp. WGS1546 TaxID=3366810 RepID=UPI00372D5A32